MIVCYVQVSSIFSVIWDKDPHGNIEIAVDNYVLHFIQLFFVYFQLCYQIVPASLYVCVEIALMLGFSVMSSFLLQTFFIENDIDCFDEHSEHIHIRNSGILDELGHVTLMLTKDFILDTFFLIKQEQLLRIIFVLRSYVHQKL